MSFWSNDTALEVGSALARANLDDRQSFADTLNVVKQYVKSKMQKYKSVAPALPGGKLEALERKYAHLGFQDLFYLARMELQLPASSLLLPAPTEAVRRRLEDAGYPLPSTFANPGSSPSSIRAPSIHTKSGSSTWVTEEEFSAGMAYTRETMGLAASRARKAQKEAEVIAAAAAAAAATTPPLPTLTPFPNEISSHYFPPLPPPPKRSTSKGVNLSTTGFGADVKIPCGCLDHPTHASHTHSNGHSYDYGHDSKTRPSPSLKLSGDYKEAPRADSPTLPVSPMAPVTPLSDHSELSVSPCTPQTPGGDIKRRHTADLRALFDVLPPEAQAMAVQRLEDRRKQEAETRLARTVRKLTADEARRRREEEVQRERDRTVSWERAKAIERGQKAKRESHRLQLETHCRELEKQRAQLVATQHLSASPEQTFQGLVDSLPTPPPRVDEDARRMIEARIAALQSALSAMGVEPGSPPLPPTPSSVSRSPALTASTSASPSPMIFPRTPFSMDPSDHSHSHPYASSSRQSTMYSEHAGSSSISTRQLSSPTTFNLDDHLDSLCRESDDSHRHGSHHEAIHSLHSVHTLPLVPLTPMTMIADGQGPRRKESRSSPPPSYTLVDSRAGRAI